MKFTTKILIGGASLIAFLFWLSFFYLAPSSEDTVRVPTVPTELSEYFPKTGVDIVYTWIKPNSQEYRSTRERWIANAPEAKDDTVRMHLRRFQYKGVDYMRFFLRGLSDHVSWARRLIIVVPDETHVSPSLNLTGTGPDVVLITHSSFMPADALPTFNQNALVSQLHRIPDLTPEFVYVNQHTFTAHHTPLSNFRSVDGDYVLPTIPGTYTFGSDFVPDLGVVHHRALEHTLSLLGLDIKDEEKQQRVPVLDTYGPVLINTAYMEKLVSTFPQQFNETIYHRFEMPSDICPLELYMHHRKLECDRGSSSFKCISKGTPTQHVTQARSADVVEKLQNMHETSASALYFPEDVLKGRFQIARVQLDEFLYSLFPTASHLELIVDDYSHYGLGIACFFAFGVTTICYLITWALGGTHKRQHKEFRVS